MSLAARDAAQPLDYPGDLIQLSLAHRKPHSGQSDTSPRSQFGQRVAHKVSLSPLNANMAQNWTTGSSEEAKFLASQASIKPQRRATRVSSDWLLARSFCFRW